MKCLATERRQKCIDVLSSCLVCVARFCDWSTFLPGANSNIVGYLSELMKAAEMYQFYTHNGRQSLLPYDKHYALVRTKELYQPLDLLAGMRVHRFSETEYRLDGNPTEARTGVYEFISHLESPIPILNPEDLRYIRKTLLPTFRENLEIWQNTLNENKNFINSEGTLIIDERRGKKFFTIGEDAASNAISYLVTLCNLRVDLARSSKVYKMFSKRKIAKELQPILTAGVARCIEKIDKVLDPKQKVLVKPEPTVEDYITAALTTGQRFDCPWTEYPKVQNMILAWLPTCWHSEAEIFESDPKTDKLTSGGNFTILNDMMFDGNQPLACGRKTRLIIDLVTTIPEIFDQVRDLAHRLRLAPNILHVERGGNPAHPSFAQFCGGLDSNDFKVTEREFVLDAWLKFLTVRLIENTAQQCAEFIHIIMRLKDNSKTLYSAVHKFLKSPATEASVYEKNLQRKIDLKSLLSTTKIDARESKLAVEFSNRIRAMRDNDMFYNVPEFDALLRIVDESFVKRVCAIAANCYLLKNDSLDDFNNREFTDAITKARSRYRGPEIMRQPFFQDCYDQVRDLFTKPTDRQMKLADVSSTYSTC